MESLHGNPEKKRNLRETRLTGKLEKKELKQRPSITSQTTGKIKRK